MSNVVEIVFKGIDGFSKTINKATGDIGGLEKAVAALGIGALAYKITDMAKASLENANAMGVAAESSGMLTEQYSALAWAAKQSDLAQASLTTGLRMLNKSIADGNNTPAGQTLEAIGVAAKDSAGKLRPMIDILFDISDKFKDGAQDANKMKIALDLFGARSGSDMVPFLNQGSAAIKDLMEQAKKLGLVVDDDFSKSADAMLDNMAALSATMDGSFNIAMKSLSPVLEELTGRMVDFATEGDTMKETVDLIASGFRVLVSTAVIVYQTFEAVVKLLGGAVAQVVALMHGDWVGAMKIGSEANEDFANRVTSAMDTVKSVWDEGAQSAAAAHGRQIAAIAKGNKSMVNVLDTTKELKDANEQYTAVLGRLNAALTGMRTPEEEHIARQKALIDLKKELGGTSLELEQAIDRENAAWERARIGTQEYKDNALDVILTTNELLSAQFKDMGSLVYQQAEVMVAATDTMVSGIGDAVSAAIVDGESLASGLESVAKKVLKTVISMLVQIGVQRMVLAMLDKGATSATSAAHKAAALGDVYVNSFASAAAIPMVGWAIAPQVATVNTALAAAGTAASMATGAGLGGVAHGGLDYVPEETTFLLQRGERVLSPRQNQDLTDYIGSDSAGSKNVTIENLTIHILEGVTNADVYTRMDKIELRNTLGQPVIDALNEMFGIGVRPDFAMQNNR